MKTRFHLTIGLLLTLAVGGSVQLPANAQDTFPITGKIVDAAGKAVAGATIERVQADRSHSGESDVAERVTSDANGAFELRGSRDLTLILARKSGLAPAWKQFTPAKSGDHTLVLTPPSVLAGVVVDESGKPVPGAEVFVALVFSESSDADRRTYNFLLSGKLARDCFNARTTAGGRFRIQNFPTNAAADLAVQLPGKVVRQERREYLSPETMLCRSGQEDIRLVVEPAGRVEGRIVVEGAAQPVPIARLTLETDGPGSLAPFQREPVSSGADGSFKIPDVAAGTYRVRARFGTNAAPDWIAVGVPVSVEAGQVVPDVKLIATRGGLLEVATVTKNDRKPVEHAGINVYAEHFQAVAESTKNGIALLRLPPGEFQVAAHKEGWTAENTTTSVEAGKTNRVEIELAPPPRITGVVRRPDGQPAAGLEVRIVGSYGPDDTKVKTDAEGRFEIKWDPRRYGRSDATFCLFIRDPERNLAVAQDIDEDTGPLDLRLVKGLTLAGRAELDGKPITNATAALVFWAGNNGMHLYGLTTGTNTFGRFEIPALPPGRRYGLYVSAPGYGQKYINAVESEAEGGRVEVDPVELRPANLKLAGRVVDADDKPVSGVYVNLHGEGQPNANARTDREGQFRFEHVCEGAVQLYANARGSSGNTTAEGGDTNVVLKLGETVNAASGGGPHKLKGAVTGPDGKPAAGVQLAVFPNSSGNVRWIKTGTNGAFNLSWNVEPWQLQSGGSPVVVVRDPARNLAAAEDLSEESTNLDVQLKPALTLAGRVQGPDDKPLTGAEVGVWLMAARNYSQISEQLVITDSGGRFEIKGLPAGPQYIVFAKAKNRGRSQQNLNSEGETNLIELEPFVLRPADQLLAGQVVNANDKPVSGVNVSLSGEDQPEGSATTDSKGRFSFKVCEGSVRLFASGSSGYANTSAEAGDTNVVIQLGSNESSGRPVPTRASLKGKPLPDLAAVGLAADATPAGKPMLLCLVDIEQRPSRRLARLLAEQSDALKQKGVTVAAVQATPATDEAFKEWKDSSACPFAVGRVTEKSEKNKWATSVESMPWLILADKQGRVVAEGFAFEELESKLKDVAR